MDTRGERAERCDRDTFDIVLDQLVNACEDSLEHLIVLRVRRTRLENRLKERVHGRSPSWIFPAVPEHLLRRLRRPEFGLLNQRHGRRQVQPCQCVPHARILRRCSSSVCMGGFAVAAVPTLAFILEGFAVSAAHLVGRPIRLGVATTRCSSLRWGVCGCLARHPTVGQKRGFHKGRSCAHSQTRTSSFSWMFSHPASRKRV
mmetsp:Transcript_26459/g.57497  ORF Transcript_26459/g.57497 Transcript_26459/m.57497 type:complete len:202 (-) Transcript_26459:145-750(-)